MYRPGSRATLGVAFERKNEGGAAQSSSLVSGQRSYTIVLTPDHDAGGYIVTCPALPGVVTQGETVDEARAMAREAIEGYLETLAAHGEPIPPGDDDERLIIESIRVKFAA